MLSDKVRNGIAITITVVWAASFLVGVIEPRYQVDAAIHGIMLVVAGGAFGSSIVKRNGNGK